MNETNTLNQLNACRICLSANTKVYNLFECGLSVAYKSLSDLQIEPNDGLPQHACAMCSIILLRTSAFRDLCVKSYKCLVKAFKEASELKQEFTNGDIQKIQPDPGPFIKLSLLHASNINIDGCDKNTCTVIQTKQTPTEFNFCFIKDEDDDLINDNTVDDMFDDKESINSDEEPLSKIFKNEIKNNDSTSKSSSDKTTYVNGDEKPKSIKAKKEIDSDSVSSEESNDNKINENDEFDSINADVIYLSKEQQILEVQSRKDSVNYLNSLYKCDKCYKGFRTDVTYRNHMVKHDPCSGAHECDVCALRWVDGKSLRSHVAQAHTRSFLCRLCSHVTKALHRAKSHNEWHKGRVFVCKICGAVFNKMTSHLSHVRIHHPSSHVCELCGESFVGEYGLKLHKTKAHNAKLDKIQVRNFCDTCGVQFANENALKAHFCDSSIKSCVECGESFTDEVLLKDHQKKHEKDRLACEEQWSGVPPSRLTIPRPGAPRGSAIVCEICGKKCTSAATLTYHQRTHTGEKPHKCPNCPKRFRIQQQLRYHIRTHTNERPFSCPQCDKAFRHKAALNRHLRVHTGSKPYTCGHCGKNFSQSNSVKTHVLTVHLKLPAPYKSKRNIKLDH